MPVPGGCCCAGCATAELAANATRATAQITAKTVVRVSWFTAATNLTPRSRCGKGGGSHATRQECCAQFVPRTHRDFPLSGENRTDEHRQKHQVNYHGIGIRGTGRDNLARISRPVPSTARPPIQRNIIQQLRPESANDTGTSAGLPPVCPDGSIIQSATSGVFCFRNSRQLRVECP
jgi:hypothetical protein